MNVNNNTSLFDYVINRYQTGHNKSLGRSLDEPINNVYFNMLIIQNSIKIQRDVSKVVKKQMEPGVKMGAKAALENMGAGVAQWIEGVSGINAAITKHIFNKTFVPWALNNAKDQLEAISENLAESADGLLKANYAFYGPFAQCYTSTEPLSPNTHSDIMRNMLSYVRDDLSTDFDLNPFNVGLISAVANTVRSVAYPIFGSIAETFGSIAGETALETPEVQNQLRQAVKKHVFSKEEMIDVTDDVITKVAKDLGLRNLHSERYHSEVGEIFKTAMSAGNIVIECAIGIKDRVWNWFSSSP
jgi:hypothetical protein